MKLLSLFCAFVSMFLFACSTDHVVVHSITGGRIELTDTYDHEQDMQAVAIYKDYHDRLDSMVNIVVCHTAGPMRVGYPESELGNLVADVLRIVAGNSVKGGADVGIVNLGAIRNSLPQGKVTMRNIYEILPFENRCCVLTLTGEQLLSLFEEVLQFKKLAVSGVSIVGDSEGHLLKSTIAGEPVILDKNYQVATIDYLAEGNSGAEVMRHASRCEFLENVWLRSIFMDYAKHVEAGGKLLEASVDGRIRIESKN